MFDIIYYQLFRFYSKVLKEEEPHFTTIFVLSALQAFLLIAIIDVVAIQGFCYQIQTPIKFSFFILIAILNFLRYDKNGRGKFIVAKKPKFFQSHRLSVLLTIVFFLVAISWLFWGGFWGKQVLIGCR